MIFIVWAILSVWSKVKRNLIISYVALTIIFGLRLAIGIPELNDRSYKGGQFEEDLLVFMAQMAVHLCGIVATFLLSRK